MHIPPFKIERYFAEYEFSVPFLAGASDCMPLTLSELLALSDPKTRKAWDNLWVGYTDSAGEPYLRQEIARLYQNIKPHQLLIASPIEAIFVAMNVLLKKDDHAIVTFPGYQALYQVGQSIGADVAHWKPQEKEVWQFDVNDLKKLIKKNTKLIIINFPHNPTGALLTRTQLQEVVELARAHNITIFSDEMYWMLEHTKADHLPAIADMYELGISLFGMSKTFGLPGLRIGWLAMQNEKLLADMLAFKDYTSICSPGPSQMLSLMGLQAKEKIIEKNLALIHHNTQALKTFIAEYPHLFSCALPKGGSVALVKYLAKEGITGLAQRALAKGIMLLPSTVFDYGDHHFRAGLGRKNFPEILEKLRVLLD